MLAVIKLRMPCVPCGAVPVDGTHDVVCSLRSIQRHVHHLAHVVYRVDDVRLVVSAEPAVVHAVLELKRRIGEHLQHLRHAVDVDGELHEGVVGVRRAHPPSEIAASASFYDAE